MAKAATRLGISQPSVSEVIADLERALDARLFDRRPRGVEPTPYGQALLKRTRAVFDELRQGVRDIEFLDDPSVGEVRIGFPAAAMATFLPDLIQKFFRGLSKGGLASQRNSYISDIYRSPRAYTRSTLGMVCAAIHSR
jgi:DNA-binding transcriptional LysR family regulator